LDPQKQFEPFRQAIKKGPWDKLSISDFENQTIKKYFTNLAGKEFPCP
jgi:hypothetical protein